MLAFLLNWRSKSFLRSSSGTSYPYPRTHTTLMVVPSTRPVGPEDAVTIRKQASRRRPPLNRSIPPIPESRSNESIMSQASRRSSDKGEAPKSSDCVIIENRNAIEQLQRAPKPSNTSIPRPSTTSKHFVQKKDSRSLRGAETPRSPLMTVARTVKSKFTKLTRMGRHEQDVSMKGSQSFSGIRQPKTAVPKRIDQNANRVIKSSSMEVPSTSQQEPSTSRHMVVIPQNPKRLEDFSEEGSVAEPAKVDDDVVMDDVREAETRNRVEAPPATTDHAAVSVTLTEDVLVVTKRVDSDDHSDQETTALDVEKGPGQVVFSERNQVISISNEAHSRTPSDRQSPTNSSSMTADENRPHGTETIHRLSLDTPQIPKEHHTFCLGEQIPDTSSELKAAEPHLKSFELDEKRTILPSDGGDKPAPRFLMTAKTPEALRKHQAFVVESVQGGGVRPTLGTEALKKRKVTIVKQRSMPETSVSPERYVLRVKTPEALRRHNTFTISERSRSPDVPFIEEGEVTEPIATVGRPAKTKLDELEQGEHNEESTCDKFTMAIRTPFTMRKFKTFVVEEKLKEDMIPTSQSADELLHSKLSMDNVDSQPVATPHIKRKFKVSENEPKGEKDEKFILTTTATPATTSNVQAYTIEDRIQAEQLSKSCTVDAVQMLEKQDELTEDVPPLKAADMYVLTTMTPLPQRKELQTVDSSHTERTAMEQSRNIARSPENVSLFIMGGRSPVPRLQRQTSEDEPLPKCAVVQPHRSELESEAAKRERSPSEPDRAEFVERGGSVSSDEMTSPEEEIPMDTHLTPTEEMRDDTLITRPIRRPPELTSPIAEETEVSASDGKITTTKENQREASMPAETPIIRPPSPPREHFRLITLSKSTSPLKRRGSTEIVSHAAKDEKKRLGLGFRSKSEDRKEKKSEEKERLKREKREEKERTPRSPKMPITARSLRSAGKKLTPAFFRRADTKIPKPSKSAQPATPLPTTRSRMHLPFRNGSKAPLAEFESLVVEDSPAVENNPLTLEKWSNSPRGKRRHSAHINGFSEPIVEESDGNGNVCTTVTTAVTSSRVECAMSPAMPRHEPARGLIDDEILDQPMLVGDTFSQSDSTDCLSAVRRMEFEAEKATLISIDRSLIEDSDTLPRRSYENGNGAPPTTTARAATVFAAPPTAYRKALEDGLSEVDDIRSQLEKLQMLVSQEMRGNEVEKLIRENEALRRELVAKDELISSLRQQIASQRC